MSCEARESGCTSALLGPRCPEQGAPLGRGVQASIPGSPCLWREWCRRRGAVLVPSQAALTRPRRSESHSPFWNDDGLRFLWLHQIAGVEAGSESGGGDGLLRRVPRGCVGARSMESYSRLWLDINNTEPPPNPLIANLRDTCEGLWTEEQHCSRGMDGY